MSNPEGDAVPPLAAAGAMNSVDDPVTAPSDNGQEHADDIMSVGSGQHDPEGEVLSEGEVGLLMEGEEEKNEVVDYGGPYEGSESAVVGEDDGTVEPGDHHAVEDDGTIPNVVEGDGVGQGQNGPKCPVYTFFGLYGILVDTRFKNWPLLSWRHIF